MICIIIPVGLIVRLGVVGVSKGVDSIERKRATGHLRRSKPPDRKAQESRGSLPNTTRLVASRAPQTSAEQLGIEVPPPGQEKHPQVLRRIRTG